MSVREVGYEVANWIPLDQGKAHGDKCLYHKKQEISWNIEKSGVERP
jgi:hypothetical protein